MRKILCIILAATLVFTLILAGCGNSVPNANNNQHDSESSNDKVYELKLHHHDAPTATVALALQEWVDRVEARCDGRLKITIYPASTLGAAADAYDMVCDGVADIAWGYTGFFPGVFPVSDIINLPMMGIPNAVVATDMLMDTWENTDYLADEYKDVHVLFIHGLSPAPMGVVGSKVESVDDLKGMTIRCGAGTATELLALIGANPNATASSEIYTSLEKGVLNGYMMDWTGVDAWHLLEQTDYICDLNYTASTCWLLMNQDSWNNLPEDIQAAFNEECTQESVRQFSQFWNDASDRVKGEAGEKLYTLSDEARTEFEGYANQIAENYIETLNDKGYNGQELYDHFLRMLDKYK